MESYTLCVVPTRLILQDPWNFRLVWLVPTWLISNHWRIMVESKPKIFIHRWKKYQNGWLCDPEATTAKVERRTMPSHPFSRYILPVFVFAPPPPPFIPVYFFFALDLCKLSQCKVITFPEVTFLLIFLEFISPLMLNSPAWNRNKSQSEPHPPPAPPNPNPTEKMTPSTQLNQDPVYPLKKNA